MGGSFVRLGVESANGEDLSATSAQEDSAKKLELLPTAPERWAGRKKVRRCKWATMSMDDVKVRRCKLGEIF